MCYLLKSLTFLLCITCNVWAHNYQVLGLGAPCMDIVICVDNSTLKKMGTNSGSQQINYDTFQQILKDAKSQKLRISSGGSCSNTIKGLSLLDHRCALFGKMGRDDLGMRYLGEMQRARVQILTPPSSSAPHNLTQVCICYVAPDGNRTMRCFPGAANDLSKADLRADIFKGVKLVHVEGYALYNRDKEYLSTALKLAKEAGAKISMDLSSFELVKQFKDDLVKLLPQYVDILFANADVVKALTGLEPFDGCLKLKSTCPVVVVIQGKRGCLVGTRNFLHNCRPFPCTVLDTTGAGDFFASGFLHAYLNDQSLEECASFGNRLGAAVCEVYGTDIPNDTWMNFKSEWQASLQAHR